MVTCTNIYACDVAFCLKNCIYDDIASVDELKTQWVVPKQTRKTNPIISWIGLTRSIYRRSSIPQIYYTNHNNQIGKQQPRQGWKENMGQTTTRQPLVYQQNNNQEDRP